MLAIAIGAGAAISAAGRPDRAALQMRFSPQFSQPAEIPYPDDNPHSDAKAELGRLLFFDPILSGSQKMSCATCHDPAASWQDNRQRGFGEKQMATRTPTLLNIAWLSATGWIGQFHDLEAVAFTPISSPGIMNLPEAKLIDRLSAIQGYRTAFHEAFGEGPITRRKIDMALATFERSIVSAQASFDRWMAGERTAISASAERGFDVFVGKGNCVACHSGFSFSDGSFHDIGSASGDDIGRGKLFPTSVALQYAFKTPTLRDVANRPPYMHDGSIATLEGVIELYDRGGVARPSRDPDIKPLALTPGEKADLVAFLKTLSAPARHVAAPVLPR